MSLSGAGLSPKVCVMAPTAKLRDEVARVLNQRDIRTTTFDADSVDSVESSAVRVSTMHRAKGSSLIALQCSRCPMLAPSLTPRNWLMFPLRARTQLRCLSNSLDHLMIWTRCASAGS